MSVELTMVAAGLGLGLAFYLIGRPGESPDDGGDVRPRPPIPPLPPPPQAPGPSNPGPGADWQPRPASPRAYLTVFVHMPLPGSMITVSQSGGWVSARRARLDVRPTAGPGTVDWREPDGPNKRQFVYEWEKNVPAPPREGTIAEIRAAEPVTMETREMWLSVSDRIKTELQRRGWTVRTVFRTA